LCFLIDEDKVPSSTKQQGLKEERISNPCPAPETHGDDETALAGSKSLLCPFLSVGIVKYFQVFLHAYYYFVGEGIDCRPRRACRNKTKDIYSLLGGVVSPYIC